MKSRVLALAALLLACQRVNPDYCETNADCQPGQLCGALRSCESVEDLATPDLATPDLTPPKDLATPDLARPDLISSDMGYTCGPGSANNCSCSKATCALSCSDPCDKTLTCEMMATCAVTCGAGCKIDCRDSTCTATVGDNAVVTCDKRVCNITCLGKCSVKEMGGATLVVACPGNVPPATCTSPNGKTCGGAACPQ